MSLLSTQDLRTVVVCVRKQACADEQQVDGKKKALMMIMMMMMMSSSSSSSSNSIGWPLIWIWSLSQVARNTQLDGDFLYA